MRLSWLLLGRELRELFVSRALWAMLLVESVLVGFSFQQSVFLYSEASKSALRLPNLVSSVSPLDGLLSPTFGAVYLLNTFLLPFVAIRLIAGERQHGGLLLVSQLPVRPARLVAIKLVTLAVGWILALVPAMCALLFWLLLSGHLSGAEVLSVVLGHAVYAFLIAGVAFVAASLTESSATAAIVVLAVTLGSWALDFAGSTQAGVLHDIAGLSPTTSLRALEHGLMSASLTLTPVALGLSLLALTAVWLPSGVHRRRKALLSAVVLFVTMLAIAGVVRLTVSTDLSENHRNSFNPADERALQQMDQTLRITVYLSPTDARRQDLERHVLSKLRRVVPHLVVEEPDTGSSGLFGGTPGQQYGRVVYEYGDQRVESRSTSAREILPLIEGLSGRQKPTPDPVPAYPGYPLVADVRGMTWWFYALLPALCVAGWWLNQRPPLDSDPLSGRRRPISRWMSAIIAAVLVVGLGQTAFAVGLARVGAESRAGVVITLRDNAFEPNLFRITGGEGQQVMFTLVNRGSVPHNLAIPDLGVESSPIVPGGTGTIQFSSRTDGTFRFLCTLPGHEQAGMTGRLTVE